jgi:type I restriction enzyme S subunit
LSDPIWFPFVPDSWTTKPVKSLATFLNGAAFKPDDWCDSGRPIIRISNLNESAEFNFTTRQVDTRYRVVYGDLLFGWSGNRGTSFGPFRWRREGDFWLNQHIFRVTAVGVDTDWLYWALKAATPYIEELAHGIIGMVHITRDKLGRVLIPVPAASEQRAIAEYLDHETAEIDALIEKKAKLIALIEARTWAHFVGLVERSDAKSVQLRRAFTFLTDGPFGSAFTSADYSDDGAVVVRLGNIGFGVYRDVDQKYVPVSLYGSFLRHKVLPGDLLIAGLGDAVNHAGRACVAPNLGPAMVKGKCFCAHVNRKVARADYLALLLSSALGAQLMGSAGRGSTRTMINLDIVKSVLVPLPTPDAQQAIVRSSREVKRRNDLIVKALTRQVTLLRERREALITAAVTGVLEIPEAA